MPKRTFHFKGCGAQFHLYTSLPSTVCKCGLAVSASSPRILPANVTERIDDYKGISWVQDQESLTKERNEEHFWKVMVPEFVRSGTYSEQTMIENGWVYYDDKGQMQIRTKPPQSE